MTRSLMDGLGLESVGRGRERGSAIGPHRERGKAVLAGSMLLFASGILSWHFGLFPASARPVVHAPSARDVEQLEKDAARTQALVRSGAAVIGSN